jgi:hypothetical protein
MLSMLKRVKHDHIISFNFSEQNFSRLTFSNLKLNVFSKIKAKLLLVNKTTLID